jgi:hypothetical protein
MLKPKSDQQRDAGFCSTMVDSARAVGEANWKYKAAVNVYLEHTR